MANPNEATTSVGGSIGTNPSVGTKGIPTQKDKDGNQTRQSKDV